VSEKLSTLRFHNPGGCDEKRQRLMVCPESHYAGVIHNPMSKRANVALIKVPRYGLPAIRSHCLPCHIVTSSEAPSITAAVPATFGRT